VNFDYKEGALNKRQLSERKPVKENKKEMRELLVELDKIREEIDFFKGKIKDEINSEFLKDKKVHTLEVYHKTQEEELIEKILPTYFFVNEKAQMDRLLEEGKT